MRGIRPARGGGLNLAAGVTGEGTLSRFCRVRAKRTGGREEQAREKSGVGVIVMQKSQFSGRLGAMRHDTRREMPCDYHNNRGYYTVASELPSERTGEI